MIPMLKHYLSCFTDLCKKLCIKLIQTKDTSFLGVLFEICLWVFFAYFLYLCAAGWLGLLLLLAECGKKIYGLHVKETLGTLSEMI